ncbi:hypothetical protein KKF55_04740 [Patescibacteria group bacterium]|nr:hypothetical protein [Patescibacteria group bacterium]
MSGPSENVDDPTEIEISDLVIGQVKEEIRLNLVYIKELSVRFVDGRLVIEGRCPSSYSIILVSRAAAKALGLEEESEKIDNRIESTGEEAVSAIDS